MDRTTEETRTSFIKTVTWELVPLTLGLAFFVALALQLMRQT